MCDVWCVVCGELLCYVCQVFDVNALCDLETLGHKDL